MDESAGRRQRWKQQAPSKLRPAARGGGGSLRLRRTPVGCSTGSLYPPTRQSRAGGATPCAGRNLSFRSVASALAPHTLRVFYWPPLPLLPRCSLRPPIARASYHPIRPRVHPPSGFAAGRGGRRSLGSQFSPYLIVRPSGSRAPRRPHAEGATRPARGFSAGIGR